MWPPFLSPTAAAPVWPKERRWKHLQEKTSCPLACLLEVSLCTPSLLDINIRHQELHALCSLPQTRPYSSTPISLSLILQSCSFQVAAQESMYIHTSGHFSFHGQWMTNCTLTSLPAGSISLHRYPLGPPLSEVLRQLLSISS